MRIFWLVVLVVRSQALVALTPKAILTQKFHDFVTGFFDEFQISKLLAQRWTTVIIDITALDIHLNKSVEDTMSDLYTFLSSALTVEQLKTLNASYKAMVKDLGEEGAADVQTRIKKVVAYALSPAADVVRATGETPDLAYTAMSRQLHPDLVNGVVSLIKETLTPTEWNSVKMHFGPMLRIVDYWERVCEATPKPTTPI
ncbi:hypothetical protein Q1695_012615 [Nippostrongylus brasiliensis]|nr:hypothetical protein Q1695_012615 [Nippostrongylus brasiliensis]